MSTILTMGGRQYGLNATWGKLPKHLRAMSIAGVAATEDGRIFAITRNHEHPVISFSPEGEYIGSVGAEHGFSNEHGIYINGNGNLWVCDSGRHVAYELTQSGELLRTLGRLDVPCDNGFRPEIPYPHNLYTVREAGKPFNLPTRAIEAPDGEIYVCDGYGNASIHRFAKDGEWMYTWGGPGDGASQFRLPHSIWLDPMGGLWVADRDNYRVTLFDRDGALIRCFDPVYPTSGMFGPSDIWGDDHHVYVGQHSVGILVYDIEARALCGIIEAHEGSAALGHSLCGDAAGNLFVGHLAPPFSVSKLERLN